MKRRAGLLFCVMLVLCLPMAADVSAERTPSSNHSDRSVVRLNDQLALSDANGNRLSSFYDSIDPFLNGVSVVSKAGKFGLLSMDGREILPCRYQSVHRADDCYVLEQKDEYGVRFGLSDAAGSILIPPAYHALEYGNGTAVVTLNGPDGGTGIVDKAGNILVPLIFEEAAPFQSGWARVVERESPRYNYINEKGEFLLDASADDCEGFFGNYALIRYGEDHFVVNRDQSMNRQICGKPIVCLSENGLFLVERENSQYIYRAGNDEYIALGQYSVSEQGWHDGLIAVRDGNGKWGFMDECLQPVIPCVYDAVQTFSDGRAWATIDGEYHFLDTEGTCRYSGKLTAASPYSEGLAAIRADDRWGFIDGEGEVCLSPSLESDESILMFIDGYCDLLLSDPYAAIYIDKDFQIFCQYDLWDILFE